MPAPTAPRPKVPAPVPWACSWQAPLTILASIMINPTIGDVLRPVEPKDILRADRMMYAESLLALVLGIALRLLVLAM